MYNEGTFKMVGAVNGRRSEVFDNKAGYGGGVYNVGTFAVSDGYSTIKKNTAVVRGGGVYNVGVFDNDHASIYSNVALSGEGDDFFEGDDVFIEEYTDGRGQFYFLAIVVMVVCLVVVGLFFYRSKNYIKSRH